MEKFQDALDFMKKNYGEDVKISSIQEQGKDIKVIWEEDGDSYFSVIGKNNYGKLIEKSGGEN